MKERNIGWRIDYVLASKALADRAKSAVVQREIGSSDHGPVVVHDSDLDQLGSFSIAAFSAIAFSLISRVRDRDVDQVQRHALLAGARVALRAVEGRLRRLLVGVVGIALQAIEVALLARGRAACRAC